ncbi:MAG: methyltransferase domain-containing protein [Pseudonocardiaceae bacterium]
MGYAFAAESDVELPRLTGLEAMFDPITTDVLTRLGVGPGWRCADVAAGSGSVTRWLPDRVGPTGQVVATDLDTRHLAAVAAPNVEVLCHDLTVDECPGKPFDLLHARALVEHLPDREKILERLARWVRPGGWLVIEDCDWTTRFPVTPAPVFEKILAVGLDFMRTAFAYDSAFGRALPKLLSDQGLVDIGCEARSRLTRGGSAEAQFWIHSFDRLREALVAAGLVTEQEMTAARTVAEDPSFATMTPTLVSTWGRVPQTSMPK